MLENVIQRVYLTKWIFKIESSKKNVIVIQDYFYALLINPFTKLKLKKKKTCKINRAILRVTNAHFCCGFDGCFEATA